MDKTGICINFISVYKEEGGKRRFIRSKSWNYNSLSKNPSSSRLALISKSLSVDPLL